MMRAGYNSPKKSQKIEESNPKYSRKVIQEVGIGQDPGKKKKDQRIKSTD
jgi:hypothetical protein